MAALSILLLISLKALHRTKWTGGPELEVTWSEAPSFVPKLCVICVMNRGESGTFTGVLELLEIRGRSYQHSPFETLYKPAWNETASESVRIVKGDFRYLLLARIDPKAKEGELSGYEFGFYRLTRGGIEWTPDHAWSTKASAPLFIVRLTILCEPAAVNSFEEFFEISVVGSQCRIRRLSSWSGSPPEDPLSTTALAKLQPSSPEPSE